MEISKKPWQILSVCGIKERIDANSNFKPPAPSHPIRNRLHRLTADLLTIIKQEGKA